MEGGADSRARRRRARGELTCAPRKVDTLRRPAHSTASAEGCCSRALFLCVPANLPERSTERLALVRELPLLPVDSAVAQIAQAYVIHKVMPADPAGDALHLALASYHKCDFLVTWNCQHLANANKFGHIRRVNTMLGLFVPISCNALGTPWR